MSVKTRVLYLLRYTESLAYTGNVLKRYGAYHSFEAGSNSDPLDSSTAYCEAAALSDDLSGPEKGMPTTQRVTLRSTALERAAIACGAFALIQYSKVRATSCISTALSDISSGRPSCFH